MSFKKGQKVKVKKGGVSLVGTFVANGNKNGVRHYLVNVNGFTQYYPINDVEKA